jgi:hypothetical protein
LVGSEVKYWAFGKQRAIWLEGEALKLQRIKSPLLFIMNDFDAFRNRVLI